MKDSIWEPESTIKLSEWSDIKSEALKSEVKQYVLYLAWSDFDDEDRSVTFNEEYYRAFLMLKKTWNLHVKIPIDFWEWLVQYEVKSFFLAN
ncbi:MAG: hypothetical protein ACD_3C00143G0002 [uncultured bacterium (gcode 4)]|uniref:Uncharacterized protein n=1 Tax=uncultured bacterium (gcode 4) TaxID=1234023 RepID=K2GWU6_9BACT|nr:MAG: hypothetical protein ACD_3C00143G0002 [uncultured bacterium (gcode 4)]